MKTVIELAQQIADQELESSIELLKADGYKALARDLCAARRPKPLTVKEQALEKQMKGLTSLNGNNALTPSAAHWRPSMTDFRALCAELCATLEAKVND